MRYRIVRDNYLGYEVQARPRWWPFWTMVGGCNTFSTVESARRYAREHAANGGVVEYLGELKKSPALADAGDPPK